MKATKALKDNKNWWSVTIKFSIWTTLPGADKLLKRVTQFLMKNKSITITMKQIDVS